jgi:hypothetical protein
MLREHTHTTICGHPWPSALISSHPRSSAAIRGHQQPSAANSSQQWATHLGMGALMRETISEAL